MVQLKIFIGTATCGIASGALDTLKELKIHFTDSKIIEVGCIGSCYLEPIVSIEKNSEIYFYQNMTEDKIKQFSEEIKLNNLENKYLMSKASELKNHEFFSRQIKRVSKNCGYIDPKSLEDYKKSGGIRPLEDALKLKPEEIIDIVLKSGLRGRGGAGFSTGLKWSFIAKKDGMKYLICNADEGDPGAFMNRSLMEGDPFRIIEGMIIAAHATGAKKGFVYVRAEKPLAAKRMQESVIKLKEEKLLGKNILGTGLDFDIEVRMGAGAYVCGEETALIKSIMGKRGMPRLKPPYPADSGIDGLPTSVNNVETFAQVTTLFEIGLDEFIKYGTEKSKGTKTFSLTGKVKRQGMIEVPLGTSLREIIEDIGGSKDFTAAQVGGPSGGCIPRSEADVAVDYESLKIKGAHMGSGGIVVTDKDNSIVSLSRFFLSFTQSESCGKCTPCREGTRRMLEILAKIEDGKGVPEDIENLFELALAVQDSSLCGLGQAAPNPVLSSLRYFKDEYEAYIKKSFNYEVTHECIDCKKCIEVCPKNAIIEDENNKVAHILQDKCIHCGACMKVCPTHAIIRRPEIKK